MSSYFIGDQNFKTFLEGLIEKNEVIGPVAKKHKFVFSKLNSYNDLRLDYDVTILPPKKEVFPTRQELVKFDGKEYQGCVKAEPKILFGVHFYDIKAMDMLDFLFTENNKDINYMANREALTVIGSNIVNVSTRAFWGTAGIGVEPKGHDAFITKIDSGYLFEVNSKKGEVLLAGGKFEKATDDQVSQAKKVNRDMLEKCPEKLSHSSQEIAEKVRKHFEQEKFWEECASDCFSCGSCNTICPTCWCFDVQDNWNLDQKSGVRRRTWDACLTEDFAKVSLGGGAEENFRESRGMRFRHRIMRKAAYSNDKLGGPACVGCGRCSSACTADIADPVTVINKIMEV